MKTQGQFLQKFYAGFQKNKPSLSKRAFAKFLNLDPSRLHDFMTDKRLMTAKMAEDVSQRLALSSELSAKFLDSIGAQRQRRKGKGETIRLTAAQFSKISDWYFFAVLALADTVDFDSNPEKIAKRLNISVSQSKEALKLLTEAGFLQQDEGRYHLSHNKVETESDIPSEDLKKSHKQSLNRVLKDIDDVDLKEREIQSVTFAGDPKKIKLAKALVNQMTQKIMSTMESGRRAEVYELNVQLVPISK